MAHLSLHHEERFGAGYAGLAVDTTSTQVSVQHPLDAEADDLPPAPVLLVATSDGKLRFYTAGHLKLPMEGIVRPPAPLPPVPSVSRRPSDGPAGLQADAAASVAAEQPAAQSDDDWVRVEQAATNTALPGDDDDADLQEGTESVQPVAELGSAAQEKLRQAAAADLPSSTDEDDESRSESDGSDDSGPRLAANRMQMPASQSGAEQRAVDALTAGDGPPLGTAHRLSPAGAAAAARHAATSQPAGGGGGFPFGGAFSFAAFNGPSVSTATESLGVPAATSTAPPVSSGSSFSGVPAFGQSAGFSMPAFGQSATVRPLFASPSSTAKPPAASLSASPAAPAAGKKVCSVRQLSQELTTVH